MILCGEMEFCGNCVANVRVDSLADPCIEIPILDSVSRTRRRFVQQEFEVRKLQESK